MNYPKAEGSMNIGLLFINQPGANLISADQFAITCTKCCKSLIPLSHTSQNDKMTSFIPFLGQKWQTRAL